MKNYSNPSPRRRSDPNNLLNSSQSLFMDETSADLENYLNTSLPDTSSVTGEKISFVEQELECSTFNVLSKSIKGKFQEPPRDSRKNKFFKSKSSDDKMLVHSTAIPVINEAMKIILKETPYKPNVRQSPKILKTYSNKHKDKAQLVESFGLPDEPFLSVDPSFSKEHNSIDLDINNDNLNKSLIFGQWIPTDAVENSEVDINDDFRRKSFSTVENGLFGEGSLETEVEKGFNFEEDILAEYASNPSNQEAIRKDSKSPVVLLKSLNWNDICLLETNNLSPSKNRQEMLLQRWQKYSSKLKNIKDYQRTNSRRNTRSITTSVEFATPSPKNGKNSDKPKSGKKTGTSGLKDNYSPEMVEEKNKEKCEENSQNTDLLSPRRITRRSTQKLIDSLPAGLSIELCSLHPKTPDDKNEFIVANNSKATNSTKERRSKPSIKSVKHENEEKDDSISKNSSGKLIDFTSPTTSRNVRASLRLSNSSTKLKEEKRSSPSGQQLMEIITKSNKKKITPKELENLSEKKQSGITLKEVDNLTILASETCVERSTDCDEINTKEQKLCLNNRSSISPSKNKKSNRPKNLNISQEVETPTRKSNRLKVQSDENSKLLDQPIGVDSSIESMTKTNNGAVEMESRIVASNENEQVEENLKIVEEVPTRKSNRLKVQSDEISKLLDQPIGVDSSIESLTKTNNGAVEMESQIVASNENEQIEENLKIVEEVPVKRPRGRPSKKKSQEALDSSRTFEDKENEKSSIDTKLPENSISTRQDKKDDDSNVKINVINNICEYQTNEENIHNKADAIIVNHNESQINEKPHEKLITTIDSETVKEENIPNMNDSRPIKRKRGRKKKNKILKQEYESEKNITEKKDPQHEAKIISNDEKAVYNIKENIKDSSKEVDEENKTSVIFDDDKSKTETKDRLHKFQKLCESDEEKEIFGESNIKQINGRKRKLCDEPQIKDNFLHTASGDKSKESIENSHKEVLGEKYENDKKTSEIMLETEFKFRNLEQMNENDEKKNFLDQTADETISDSEEMKKTDKSNVTVEYLDFGYDIHRRTSFRKILERVMEVSRSEMAKLENDRNQRCKSVPHEEFHRDLLETLDVGVKSASADSKLKYLKDKKNTYSNIYKMDLSKVKKCLDYDSHSKTSSTMFPSRKKAKSIHVVNGKNSYLEENKSSKNGVVTKFHGTANFNDDDPKKIVPQSKSSVTGSNTDSNHEQQEKLLDDEFSDVKRGRTSDSRLSVASCSVEKDSIDQEDLEVQKLMLGKISINRSLERTRSKSFSGGSRSKSRAKSVQSRKRNRASGGLNGSADARKVIEFEVGDSVWGKVGNYPYWPGLVMEDPETSDFKKFRLLRATPYYHIRFFGDKGKRAWTAHCIPYEGPNDLDILREQFSMERCHYDYLVKATHSEKWKKAVEEAELIKNYPLKEKLEFFDKILPNKERNHTSEDTEEENLRRSRSKSFSCTTNMQERNKTKTENTPQKEKTPMKISSLVSCIENVVKNFSPESTSKVSSTWKKISPMEDTSDRNVTNNSVKNSDKSSFEMRPDLSPPKKGSISMKDSSVAACIEEVVKKFCSPQVDDLDENSTKRKTRESKKNMEEEEESDIDIGLALLEIPATDVATASAQKIDSKSPRRSPEQSTSSGTPVSSRRASVISPTRTRSRTSLKLEKRRLSDEFKRDVEPLVSSKEPKGDLELSSSPRRLTLKRRTIEIGRIESETEMNAKPFLNDVVPRLPEFKKNLFRGVTREKVCQICEKPGDVVKCRGPCNGDFHIKCVEDSLKQTEELTLKEEEESKSKKKIEDLNSHLNGSMEDNKQVEISTVMCRKKFADNVVLSPINRKIPMMEQFDRKMKELMSQVESRISIDSTDSSSEEIDATDKVQVDKKPYGKNSKKLKGTIKHVTADDVSVITLSNDDATKDKPTFSESVEQGSNSDEGVYKCPYCISSVIPVCFVCNQIVSKTGNTMRQRCSLQKCGRYYHLECLNFWHQTQWSFILHDKRKSEALDSFVCPRHSCHICASENLGFSMGRCPNGKLVKCLRCPATYHNSYHCVPAGTDILTSTQIVCPRCHVEGNKKSNTLNTIWCFVCSEGGNLICCETCPTSVHSECLQVNLLDDDTYICEDCESGRFPLYDEVVWVKCGTFRWWPAIILFPSEIPANVESKPHSKGEFVVKFFGTYNYFWVGRGRVFLYQEGDTGYLTNTKNKIDEAFIRAIKEAADVYNFKKGLRAKKQKEVNNDLKPPPYVRIKVNRPVGNVRVFEGNLSNTNPCDCDPKDKSPCGPNSNCLNRILLTECNPEICPAGEKCKNQAFEKREYPQVKPYRTAGRGWGLKSLEPIKKGQFVIEYVGEIIDDEEYQRRITRMHQQKDENYYFLTIDKDRMLDAGPKGNAARFMNHSCNPNCETQKWTVNGDTRVGLFAIENIAADTELTFNYNLECAGTEKKICRCGAPNCSGFIGVKPEDQRSSKKNPTTTNDSCFICGQSGDVGRCSHKSCLKSYHLECVQLRRWPKGQWKCPSHSCNVCSKRTSRICVHCNNSYCPNHSEGNLRNDESLGFLCSQHDQPQKNNTRSKTAVTQKLDSSPSKKSSPGNEKSETLRSERYKKRTSGFESNIPQKRRRLND